MKDVSVLSDNTCIDEIQYLYQTEPLKCQLCNASLQPLSVQQRQAHYESHFEEQSIENNLNKSDTNFKQADPTTTNMKETVKAPSQSVFWLPTQTTPPPNNFTPGLVHVLKHALLKTHARGLTSKAVLCHSGAIHIATEFGDITWGCGYRNFLMACASLMTQDFQPLYFPLLDDPERPPGIRNLQYWIEEAWANDFDREGAVDLKHKLVGTRKWIGTGELYVAFTSKGIPAQLVDFPGTHRGPEAVMEWIINYFSPKEEKTKHPLNAFEALKEAKPIVVTERMPIILQHAGHSRTVVGYEMNKKGDPNLLVFDPAKRMKKNLRQAALSFNSPADGHEKERKFLDRLFRPCNKTTPDRKKRRISSSGDGKRETKRAKGKQQESTLGDKDVIVIDDGTEDSGGEEPLEDLDPVLVLNSFRVNQTKLAKKDKYQILYFPLEKPLTEEERWARRVVTSVVYL